MENMVGMLAPKPTEEMIRKVIKDTGAGGVAFKNISNDDYHNGPGISSSDIKELLSSNPGKWLEGKKNPKDPTPALILGNAIHCRVLEPDEFPKRYCNISEVPMPGGRNTKDGKDEWKAYCEQFKWDREMTPAEWSRAWRAWKHPYFHKIGLTEEELETCAKIAESIQNHPMVSQLFAHGHSEMSLYWIDEQTDILCKCRPDRLNDKFPCIPDLKSTLDASLDSFEGDITLYGYNLSAWWYLWGSKKVMGVDYGDFVYVPAEKNAPWQVTYYLADQGSLEQAEGLCRAGLLIYRRYLDQKKQGNEWTGYSLEAKSAGIRPWAFNKLSQVIHSHDLHGLGLEKYVGVI